MASRRPAAFTLALVLVIGTTLIAAPARAALLRTFVDCGDTFNHSILVANNLVGCDDGLGAVADGITIDLGGHILTGTGGALEEGVNLFGRDGVTIRNGTLRGFGTGMNLSGSEDATIQNVEIDRTEFNGVMMTATKGSRLLGVRVLGSGGMGARLEDADDNQITDSEFVGNVLTGLQLQGGSERNRITGTSSTNNDSGIVVTDSPDTKAIGGVVRGNDEYGLRFFNSNGGVAKNVRSSQNGVGIYAEGSSVTFRGNRTTNNSDRGIFVWSSSSAKVIRNVASGNGHHGIETTILAGATIKGNKANRNGFTKDGPDGVGRGISAANNTPGGGNSARGNDDPLQCVPSHLC